MHIEPLILYSVSSIVIVDYHNHRRYSDGVRKGKTPMEILQRKEQADDWISMLFDIIKEKDPELLLDS